MITYDEVKPYKCPNSSCSDYRKLPICQTHAHVYCERFDAEKVMTDFQHEVQRIKRLEDI